MHKKRSLNFITHNQHTGRPISGKNSTSQPRQAPESATCFAQGRSGVYRWNLGLVDGILQWDGPKGT